VFKNDNCHRTDITKVAVKTMGRNAWRQFLHWLHGAPQISLHVM